MILFSILCVILQAFSVSKVNKIPNFSTKQTSLLSWSLAPSHSRPDVAEYNTGLTSTESGLNLTLQKSEYNNSYASLLKALVPTCEEFILECSLKEGHSINGSTCCNNYFNLEPMLNQHGKCNLICIVITCLYMKSNVMKTATNIAFDIIHFRNMFHN